MCTKQKALGDLGCLQRAKLDMQLTQLLLIHRAWRLGEQALRALCLGECNHIADGLCASHQRDDPIQTECQAAVRWGTVLQRIQQESKLELRFVR